MRPPLNVLNPIWQEVKRYRDLPKDSGKRALVVMGRTSRRHYGKGMSSALDEPNDAEPKCTSESLAQLSKGGVQPD